MLKIKDAIIIIFTILALCVICIFTFCFCIKSIDLNIAEQMIDYSYRAIRDYDLGDNGYLDGAANGVLVYKEKCSTVGYYAIVTDGEVGEIVVMKNLEQYVKASQFHFNNKTDINGQRGSLAKVTVRRVFDLPDSRGVATAVLENTKGEEVAKFVFVQNGFSNVSLGNKLVSGEENNISGTVFNGTLSEIANTVCFYNIGEGLVIAK